MAWNIGDEGFEMVLGNYVPHIIDDHIIGALEPLLARESTLLGLPYRDIRHWAIHPGGRSILDKVQSRLDLSDEQLVPARETLRNYGNMSSATVLFVLRHILDLPAERCRRRRGTDLLHGLRARPDRGNCALHQTHQPGR